VVVRRGFFRVIRLVILGLAGRFALWVFLLRGRLWRLLGRRLLRRLHLVLRRRWRGRYLRRLDLRRFLLLWLDLRGLLLRRFLFFRLFLLRFLLFRFPF